MEQGKMERSDRNQEAREEVPDLGYSHFFEADVGDEAENERGGDKKKATTCIATSVGPARAGHGAKPRGFIEMM